TRRRDRVTRVYSYLSIGNDIMVGLEFLVGSFEFFPSGNEILGVYLFIAGSSQLLIRPIIEISRRIHLYRINRTGIDLE
ncbi:MAG: YrhK family protein, partial [Candidatus Thermoplasmatota archaeon]|nr:YrhK family protein [Candidatus Thermoplasmatota archaeon]